MKKVIDELKEKPWIPVLLLALVLAVVHSCGSGGYGGGGNPTGPGGGGGGSKELNSGDLAFHATYTHRFANAGTFRYHCVHHPMMTGSVVVSAASVDTLVNVSIISSMAPFHAASVKPGGRVRWTNDNGLVHTVTSN